MRIEIVKNSDGNFGYTIDGERVHEKSWPYIWLARRAALKHRPAPKPKYEVKEVGENANEATV